jgi:hypothetical protein
MSLVNELIQSVRFLKYMGWGKCSTPTLFAPRQSLTIPIRRVTLDYQGQERTRDGACVAGIGERCLEHYCVSQALSFLVVLMINVNFCVQIPLVRCP